MRLSFSGLSASCPRTVRGGGRVARHVRLRTNQARKRGRLLRRQTDGPADHQLADQRRQPVQPALLTAHGHRPRQRGTAQGCLARASARLGHRAAVLGLRAADRGRRRRLREHGRQRRVRAVDRHRRDPLAVRGEPRSEHHLRLLRLEQQGRGDQRRQGLHRAARRPARGARSCDRQSRVVDSGRALAGQLLDHRGAPVRQRHGHHRLRRRRSRHAQPPQGVRREGWPSDLDLLHDSRSWRARSRDVAEGQRRVEVRRCGDLADAGHRSRARSHLFLDRQCRSRLQRRLPRRRQPVRGVDGGDRARRPESIAGTFSRCITTSGTTTRSIPSSSWM